MKVKNYLIGTLYRITANTYGDTNKYNEYAKAYELSRDSFQKNLKDCDEMIMLTGEVDHIQKMFKDHLFRIYEIWKSEPCNILYCGPDTFCRKPLSIFGKFDNFCMFNYTDPRSAFGFKHFFNADVRYYPHNMEQDIWDLGLRMAEQWDLSVWNTEQIILNKMLWEQTIKFKDVYRPDIAWQGIWDKKGNGNIDLEDAKIVHFHATRNVKRAIDKMQKWSDK